MPSLRAESGLAYSQHLGQASLEGILESHRFLFRLQVFPEADFNTQDDLVAPRFLGQFGHNVRKAEIRAVQPLDVTLKSLLDCVCVWDSQVKSTLGLEAAQAAVQGQRWRAATPWLSTTPSLAYTLFEGQRREKMGWTAFDPGSAEIVIIDTHALALDETQIVLAKDAIEDHAGEFTPYQPNVYHRAIRMSYMFQTVLVYGCVPREAIAARWNWAKAKAILMPLYHACAAVTPGCAFTSQTTFRDYTSHCEGSHAHIAAAIGAAGSTAEHIIGTFWDHFEEVSRGLVATSPVNADPSLDDLAVFTAASLWMLRTRWFQPHFRSTIDQQTLFHRVQQLIDDTMQPDDVSGD